jgi:general secretion pathway protein L
MNTLLLVLAPPERTSAVSEYDYVLADATQLRQGRAPAALLPAPGPGAALVALIPARHLSWHCLTVPQALCRRLLKGRMPPAQVRTLLAGLMEEFLLEEVQDLHFALFAVPGTTDALWVAVCQRSWLEAALQDLASAGRLPVRLVAQACPVLQGPSQAWVHAGESGLAQMLLATPQVVCCLPLGAAAQALAAQQDGLQLSAEPAVSAPARQLQAGEPQLQTAARHLLEAAQSPWNLLQLEWSPARQGRWRRSVRAAFHTLRASPAWRPVRWGLLALAVLQLGALNALALHENSLLQHKREAAAELLTRTFPEVGLVIDAPLQLQRGVQALALSRGEGAGLDLARVLAALAPLASPEGGVTSIDLQESQLRLGWHGKADAAAVQAALWGLGYRATLQEGTLLVQAREEP